MNNMNLHQKIIGTISVFSILLVLITGFASSIFSSVNALDFDVSDFKCIAAVGNMGDNICSEDNSDNSQDNDVTISDSFNPNVTQICGNNDGSTSINNTSTCTIDIGNSIAPSTLGLS
jgi:hypothetical protein